MKSFFSVQVLLFLAWVAITTAVFYAAIHFGFSRGWIFVPLVGGLAYLLWPAKRKPPVAMLALLLLASAASCARPASLPEQASTYTDARGFEVPVQTTADSVRARW
ncbi:hypothetical protein D0N36_19265 [Hymenobacter lapidiphilus]|uniref:hypothetical protein n=1 Tax=Hymenobacter sp. CCM 8763 TaxID=2303334 RepID=UPI000E350397|nr:hypothetical protein [Hymenobacter sp. CCM 8763]RFP63481.1 hypothetical protein D0N36_19265 [Hymenobacter sp. CCM 8763]